VTADADFITLIPVNRLDQAKGRLDGLLSPEERSSLALITTQTVVAAAAALGPMAVLTADELVRKQFRSAARILDEDAGLRGLNAQLESALERLSDYGSVLILHADLPLADSDSLRAFVEAAAADNSVTIVRPADGGTNAMLLRPPGRFPLAYGVDSCALHVKAAERAGMAVTVVASAALEIDLDTPEDLEALLATAGGRDSSAGRYLVSCGVEERLAAS
jgi:2-phospho-L-lactate/phosphoenolpyruvate guanylyltransferase